MPAKTPMYLKAGKNGLGKNSKKLRELLSTDMISPPLDDFRHMAHIGRGGDSDRFGDISFMKNPQQQEHGAFKRAASWGKKKRTTSATVESATLDRKPRKRNGMDKTENNPIRMGPESPILKNAVSLPSLNKQPNSLSSTPPDSPKDSHNNNTINGKTIPEERLNPKQADELYKAQPTPNSAVNGTLDGPPKPRRIMADSTTESSIDKNKLSPLRRSSEVLSVKPHADEDDSWDLNLDLGPSLLDDVLGIMDRISV